MVSGNCFIEWLRSIAGCPAKRQVAARRLCGYPSSILRSPTGEIEIKVFVQRVTFAESEQQAAPSHPLGPSIFTDAEFSMRRPIQMLIFTTPVFNATDILAAGWFQFRGPQRNELSREATLPMAKVGWHRIQL
jgi:hypothetical protein